MLVFKYTLFAILSTLLNLLFQYISFSIYSGTGNLYIAMLIGTLAGLICKYVLDKKYIFYHQPQSKTDDGKKFLLYTLMGVVTTIIFWGTEIGFELAFESEFAKYIGAVIGLSIGYVAKYFLDKKYVFNDAD